MEPVAPAPATPATPAPATPRTSGEKPIPNVPPVLGTQAAVLQKKRSKLLIIIIAVSALVLVGAGVLGIFWESWFGS